MEKTAFDNPWKTIIDWMLNLPKEIEQQFALKLDHYEEQQKMRYITNIERNGIEKGLKQGLKQGLEQGLEQGEAKASQTHILDILSLRFQQTSENIENTLSQINDLPMLSSLFKEAMTVESMEIFEAILIENCKKLALH